MSQKKILFDLYQKLKERANLVTDDAELHDYVNKLDAEINAMYEAQSDEEDGGGNNPPAPKIP